MNAQAVLAEADPVSGTRWRVAVVRPAGNAGRLAAADIGMQLRRQGGAAIEVDTGRGIGPRGDRIGDSRRPEDAYDLVLALADLAPDVLALGVSQGITVAHVPLGASEAVTAGVVQALAAGDVEQVPVLDVTVDGERRFTLGPVAVASDEGDREDLQITWHHGERSGSLRTGGCRVDPPTGPADCVRLEASASPPIEADAVRVDAAEQPLRVAIDRRTRRAHRIAITGIAAGLTMLRLPKRPSE